MGMGAIVNVCVLTVCLQFYYWYKSETHINHKQAEKYVVPNVGIELKMFKLMQHHQLHVL